MEEIVNQTLPSLDVVAKGLGAKGNTAVEQAGHERAICELAFYGYNQSEMGRMLSLSHDTINRYMKTPRYHALYAQVEGELLGKLGDALYRMATIGAAESMRGKLKMMRDLAQGKSHRDLLNKMYTEFIELWAKLKPGAGGDTDSLVRETWTRIQERKLADGTKETLKQEITGRQKQDGGSETPRLEPLPSLPGGEECPEEAVPSVE